MAKQFLKVTKTYATKNKLQLLILNKLEQVDGMLFKSKIHASNYVIELYNNALTIYKGKAAVPALTHFMGTKYDLIYQVEDVIHISIYAVKNDLS